MRKTYLLSSDGLTAGAVYAWRDRAAAERLYSDEWRQTVTQLYGVAPDITFLSRAGHGREPAGRQGETA